jgi:adenine-specific DNA-methyltransferase
MPVLQFKGKTAIECYHHTLLHHRFEFDEKLSLLEAGERPGLDGNLIIEGDNLLALKALLPTHAGRIKCVYIDPPYNTGEEKWVYNDNLTQPQFKEWIGQAVGKEGEDATRHDKWCCIMYPRLNLLKELLTDNGLIFVSIDDNEIANLNFLLDEIFGSENRIERMVWKKSYGGGAKESHIVTLHEYILCYAKDKRNLDSLELNPDPLAVERYYKYKDSKFETRGPYRLKPLEATKSMGERKNLVYAIPMSDGTEVWPKRQWWWRKQRAIQALANDELVFTKGKDGISVSYKQYLKDESGEERGAKLFSVIDGIYTQEGTNDLKEVFSGNLVLPFPKPVRLIKRLLELIYS